MDELYTRGVEKMLEGELEVHLGYSKHNKSETKNARTGFGKKTIKTKFGKSTIQVPRDINFSFESVVVPKRSQLSQCIETLIISLYAKGIVIVTLKQLQEIYDFRVSTSVLSTITDKITDDIIAWQNRPLENTYLIVWMDGIVFKVRENSKVINQDCLHCNRSKNRW